MILVVVVLFGCGGSLTVQGEVVHPAAIPVRSFARAWVVRGPTVQEGSFASALAHHLEGGVDVRVVPLAELEPARLAGRIPAATIVLLARLEFRRRSVTRWTSRPQTVCGAAGCYRTRRSYAYEVPTLRAEVVVTVYDGPTATILEDVTVDATEEGRDYDVMENRAVVTLVRKLATMVEQRIEIVDVVLLDVDLESLRAAIALIDAGDWPAGRRALEEVARDEAALSRLERPAQARVFYDLGMARLFDRSTLEDPETHFAAAAAALSDALGLDPDPRYQRALRDIDEHRQRFEAVQRQDAAADHDFRLEESGVPEPPAAYRTETGTPTSVPAGTP